MNVSRRSTSRAFPAESSRLHGRGDQHSSRLLSREGSQGLFQGFSRDRLKFLPLKSSLHRGLPATVPGGHHRPGIGTGLVTAKHVPPALSSGPATGRSRGGSRESRPGGIRCRLARRRVCESARPPVSTSTEFMFSRGAISASGRFRCLPGSRCHAGPSGSGTPRSSRSRRWIWPWNQIQATTHFTRHGLSAAKTS